MVRAKFKVTEITRHMGSRKEGDAWVPAEMQTGRTSPHPVSQQAISAAFGTGEGS